MVACFCREAQVDEITHHYRLNCNSSLSPPRLRTYLRQLCTGRVTSAF